MLRLLFIVLASGALSGCFVQGNWIPTIWGGQALEDGVIEGDCDVRVDAFVLSVTQGALLTADGTASAVLPGNQLFDLAQPGPQSMASIDVKKGVYPETVWFLGAAEEPGPSELLGRGQLIGSDNAASDMNPILGNATAEQRDTMIEAGAVLLVEGSIACLSKADRDPVERTFSWPIQDEAAALRCQNPDLEIVGGSFGASTLAVAGEEMFDGSDGLTNEVLWASGADGVITSDDAGAWFPTLMGRVRLSFSTADERCAWERLEE